MFYSHEILTSRQYGVATVWLVATLGAKSALKKVSRKEILEVNVPKACETILAPEAPMALRLQSNLLYGVSRVYSQQCGYVLVDAQHVQTRIRTLLKAVKNLEIDPDAGKARPEQLVLPDDPTFFPEIDLLGLDLELPSVSISGSSSFFSPHSNRSSLSSGVARSVFGARAPPSDLDLNGQPLPVDDDLYQAGRASSLGFDPLPDDEQGDWLLPDVDFEFDEEGNVRDIGVEERRRQSAIGPVRPRLDRSSAISGRVRLEHEAGLRAANDRARLVEQDYDVFMQDEDNALPQAEAFPELAAAVHRAEKEDQHDELAEDVASEAADAPMRQRQRRLRRPKVLGMDTVTELRRHDVTSWNRHYLRNMAAAAQDKASKRASKQAKQNAELWVFGSLGGLSGAALARQLQDLSGAALTSALVRDSPPPAGKKRSREDDGDSERRRVRERADDLEHELGRGDRLMAAEEEDAVRLDDDDIYEVGREALPELQDYSSAMPWNISASLRGSRHGSSVARGRTMGGSSIAAGRASSVFSGIGPRHARPPRRASRLLSSSPVPGRGGASSDLIRLSSLELPEDDGDGGVRDGGIADQACERPDAAERVPAAARAALDRESLNFLDFVRADLDEAPRGPTPAIAFQLLLAPAQTSRVVAAQGFYHVLSLATKGLIEVQQAEPYGEIALKPAV